MSDYTPDESIVREFYVEAAYALGTDPSEGVREFDRLIARIKADALLEFVESAQDLPHCSGDTRWKSRALDRADRIEKEAGL